MTNRTALILLAVLSGWAGVRSAVAGTAVIIQPVSASGAHTIIGTDIFLPTGPQRVGFEVRVSGWGDRELKTVQVRVDATEFDNGTTPIDHAEVACPGNNITGHNYCAQNLGPGSRCGNSCPSCVCSAAFQNITRSDYVGFGFGHVSAVDDSTPNIRFGITLNDEGFISDPGGSLYLGTMMIDVPTAAQGKYNINVFSRITTLETFLQDANGMNIPITLHSGARIIIGEPVAPGSRYVAVEPEEPGEQTAVRVVLTSLYHPGPPVAAGEDRDFSALEGEVRWLGPPETFPDAAPEISFLAAQLQCTPHFADWGSMGTVQVYGDAIIPSSVYTVFQVPISCEADPNDPFCFGLPQIVHTAQWGDVASPFARSDQPAQPDMVDIAEMIDSFRRLTDATPKALTHLRGPVPDPATEINFADIDLAVDAIRGQAYPYPVPTSCPP